MKKLPFILFFLTVTGAFSQNLFDDSNAASPANESNSTAGMGGTAQIFSDNTDAQSGAFSLRAESTNNNGRLVSYTFDAVVGEDYDITIWAREGAQSNSPAFANWQGFQAFPLTVINGNTWTEYSWTLTASQTNPVIRIFTSPFSARFEEGNTIFLDNITIIQSGGGGADTEAPSAITDLSSANTTSTATDLTWSASTDNIGVINYEVFQDGVSIANTGTTTAFNVTGLAPSTSYDFTVFAEDAAGNTSLVSNTETTVTNSNGGVVDYTSENSNMVTVDWTARDLFADRNVGIGTTDTQGYMLAVAGNVIAEGVKVELQGNWPDFVFGPSFDLKDLEEVKRFIDENGHLPNIPSAIQVQQEGIDLGSMNAKLLQKIEELTLYLLEQDAKIKHLEEENNQINSLLKRIEALERTQK